MAVSPSPAPSRGRGSRPPGPRRLPARVTAPARPPPKAGPRLRRGSSSRTAPRLAPPAWPARRTPGGRRGSPRTPSVRRGVPGNAGLRPSPAPPRPCLWELSGGALGLARCPAGPRRCHPPQAGTATPPSPLCPPRPVGTCPHDSSPAPGGLGGCGAVPSPTLEGPASPVLGPRRNRRKGVVLLLRSTTTQLAVLPRAGSLTSLSLRFFICKVGRTVETSQGCGEKCNYVGTQLAHGQLSIMAVLFPVRGK